MSRDINRGFFHDIFPFFSTQLFHLYLAYSFLLLPLVLLQ